MIVEIWIDRLLLERLSVKYAHPTKITPQGRKSFGYENNDCPYRSFENLNHF